jgi:predicted RNA-binding Zn-ribbon protein involved in translation (DUF1610 family)
MQTSVCSDCGAVFGDETAGAPCPKCGSIRRTISVGEAFDAGTPQLCAEARRVLKAAEVLKVAHLGVEVAGEKLYNIWNTHRRRLCLGIVLVIGISIIGSVASLVPGWGTLVGLVISITAGVCILIWVPYWKVPEPKIQRFK